MKALVWFFALSLTACADSFVRQDIDPNLSQKLERSGPIMVVVPQDGIYETKIYAGSGAVTANEVVRSFSKYVSDVRTEKLSESFESILAGAKAKNYAYVVRPEILHWEDRNTEWSGRPDVISVKITVIKVNNGKTAAASILNGKSGIWTFGGDHPQDLLSRPLDDFTAHIF